MKMHDYQQLFSEEVILDLETPLTAFLKLKRLGAFALLESVEKGEQVGRYSYVAVKPQATLKINSHGLFHNSKLIASGKRAVLNALRQMLFAGRRLAVPEADFCGGWIGYFGYEFLKVLADFSPSAKPYPFRLPLGLFILPEALLVFDHLTHRTRLLILSRSAVSAGELACQIKEALRKKNLPLLKNLKSMEPVAEEFNYSSEEFLNKVKKLKEHIFRGDIIQAVLSRQIVLKSPAHPLQIYRALRIINPSPYMFYIDFKNFKLIGASPESHLKVVQRKALVKPIAGTRPRGKDREHDALLEKELLENEKERAEHTMLIDLARNDLGKVCRPGTVQVTESFSVERYSHVMHLVSCVQGELEENRDAFDALLATFPAGTVSGAPKIRAMELIDQQEPTARGPYAGVVGYCSFNGNVDFCIAIRMLVWKNFRSVLQAGAGIVEGSQPEAELLEVQNKMEVLKQALLIARKEVQNVSGNR